MLEHQDYLSLIAQLAVTLAGFTGIVTVFRVREGELLSKSVINFQAMLRASISALFLSLTPYLLYSAIGDTDLAWRIGNVLVFSVMSANIYYFVTRGGMFRTALMQRLLLPSGAILTIANLLGAFQVLKSDVVFIIAVSFQLFVSANNFILLILSDFSSSPVRTEDK